MPLRGGRDSKKSDELKEDLPRDALDTTAASQAADGGLRDALDVVAQHLAVALSPALAQTLATFATTRHVFSVLLS